MDFANTLSGPDVARRNRQNPYRKLWFRTEGGFVELNKINARYSDEEIERIKRGVEAARELADLMARAAVGDSGEQMKRRRQRLRALAVLSEKNIHHRTNAATITSPKIAMTTNSVRRRVLIGAPCARRVHAPHSSCFQVVQNQV